MAVTPKIVGSRSAGDDVRTRLLFAAGVAPLVLLALVSLVTFVDGLNPGSVGFDFRGAYLRAAERVLDGDSPYPPLEGPEIASFNAYVYPPLVAFASIPFTVLPAGVASGLAVALTGIVLLATLWALNVRDWRCYAAVALWAPTTNALHMASASALVALAAALAWRYRDTVWQLGGAVGLGIATKLLLWPLVVWALVTGRARAAGVAVFTAATVSLALWAVLGFDGLGRYPAVLRRLAELEAQESYSLVGAFTSVGIGDSASRALAVAIAVALLGLCAVYGRRGADFASFSYALAAALAFSPIVWLHYLVLLLVPLGIAKPRFSAVWLLPMLLWLTPLNGNGEAVQPLLPMLVAAGVFALVLAGDRRRRFTSAPEPAASRA